MFCLIIYRLGNANDRRIVYENFQIGMLCSVVIFVINSMFDV